MLQKGETLIADANTGWTQHAAIRVVDAIKDVDVYVEQPCISYEQCLVVRRHTSRPFVLDEVMDNASMVVRGHFRPGDGRDQFENFREWAGFPRQG